MLVVAPSIQSIITLYSKQPCLPSSKRCPNCGTSLTIHINQITPEYFERIDSANNQVSIQCSFQDCFSCRCCWYEVLLNSLETFTVITSCQNSCPTHFRSMPCFCRLQRAKDFLKSLKIFFLPCCSLQSGRFMVSISEFIWRMVIFLPIFLSQYSCINSAPQVLHGV